MSQAKVNKYKEEKANRKELIKKEKRQKMIKKVVTGVVAAVLLVWVGFSIPKVMDDMQVRESYEVDYTSVDSYLNSIK